MGSVRVTGIDGPDGLKSLAADFDEAARVAPERTRQVVQKGLLNIKNDWRREWTGLSNAPSLAGAVTYPAIVDPSWSSTASMSTGRIGPIGAAISTNRVLVAGGLGAGFAPLATAELYDPTARTWAATASMSVARSNHAAAIRGTGTVLVTGGFDSSGNILSSVESYNPSTGAWTTRPSMNKARAAHRLTTLSNGDVLVTGGTSDA
jgi:hypothetical protein